MRGAVRKASRYDGVPRGDRHLLVTPAHHLDASNTTLPVHHPATYFESAGIGALIEKRVTDRRYPISGFNSIKSKLVLKNPKCAHIISTRWRRVLTTPPGL
jgi:hypothetical protein